MSQENRKPSGRQPGEEQNAAPRPRKRRKRSPGARLAFVVLYVIAVIGVSVLLACVGWIAANDVLALNKEYKAVTITIDPDDDMNDVVNLLEEKGFIEYKFLFKLFAAFTNGDDKISAGTFTLNTDMDYSALINGMKANSSNRAKVSITIPEGYTVDQIFRLMAEQGVVNDIQELYDVAAKHDYDFSFLKDIPLGKATRLEGYLYPDTYEFYTPHDATWAINKMLVNFDSRFTEEMRKEITDSGRTIHEIVTIASMIEKETDGEDRGNIASVIYNRLNNTSYETVGKLEIDATIYYITGEPVTWASRENTNSPYNTFKHAGLPPGPIASPGMNSIKAAISPSDTGYYYYALGDDGKHHFFKTYSGLQEFTASQELYKNP